MFLASWIISSHEMYDIEPLIWATAQLYNIKMGYLAILIGPLELFHLVHSLSRSILQNDYCELRYCRYTLDASLTYFHS